MTELKIPPFDWIWIATRKWTGAFDLNLHGNIITTPPIGRKFTHWNYRNLLKWLQDIDQLLDWKLYYKEK
jgi:hypothetical protein